MPAGMTDRTRLKKSENAVLAGVCGGVAEFVGWPARKVRLLWVLGTLLSGGVGALIYTVLAVAMPAADGPGGDFRLENYRRQ